MEKKLREILLRTKKGEMTIKEGMERLKVLPFLELGYAKIDTHRPLRRDFGEVIYGEGKRKEEILGIVAKLKEIGEDCLITRLPSDLGEDLVRRFGGRYFPSAKIFALGKFPKRKKKEKPIPIITAGTSDIPVAEEAAVFLELLGYPVKRIYDVGVAGIHRTFSHLKEIRKGRVIIVIAGMEGALASVVSGLVSKPVIAVPTSYGYGANFQGLSALLAMLASCSPGIGVVNIDNGFGAAYLAHLILSSK
ncbi:MAG: nickel pincer cofactor biosynthesis protein LarB [candidate division WOR-3 bacterium]